MIDFKLINLLRVLIKTNPRMFSSIPTCVWWAVITMSTIGYGDIVPSTPLGKCVGASCALTGILCFALPVPAIIHKFQQQVQVKILS